MTTAVVFAYHNVGVRCLKTLLAHRVEVPLLLTHDDDAKETIWFDRVATVAAEHGIRTIAPTDPNAAEVVSRVGGCRPDFIFSFYYRLMLKPPLLALPASGALNMHGSLLPKYRGRAPVNWAIIHGETETGATLHYMTARPDEGDIVAQTPVPILPDDTAREVFDKVTVAAELTLHSVLPALTAGTAPRVPQDPSRASYFGSRKPEDGIIDWSQSAARIHNLVRAVAPPYPGARTVVAGRPARILRTRVLDAGAAATRVPTLSLESERLIAHCGGGGALVVHELEIEGTPLSPEAFAARMGPGPMALGA
jgi:methionyl-tRNA formyltransferase